MLYQTFPIPVGATELTVMPEIGPDVAGRTIGVAILHGAVILGSSGVIVDGCGPITVGTWAVDQGVAPHD